jgi:hypothetical protein
LRDKVPIMPWETTRIQRSLTVDFITKRRLLAPVVSLKPESAIPVEGKLEDTFPHWGLSEDDDRNFAIQLVEGYIELKIKAPDDIWTRCLFDACRSLQVDARAAYGGRLKPISSILLKIDNPTTIDSWVNRWPRGHKDKGGGWVETKFVYSLQETPRSKLITRLSSPLPGSRFGGDLVVWRPLGKPAAENEELGLEDLELRPIAPTNMESICRAIAFATLAYWIRIFLDGFTNWDESLTRAIAGWAAREIREGRDINARGKSLENMCWASIDDAVSAGELITFMRKLGAPAELNSFFLRAIEALDRNPSAPVAGWKAIETIFGIQAKVGLRRAFRAGLDLDLIERMSEQYVLDASDHNYLDREALLRGTHWEHKHDDLIKVWENETVYVGKKPHNPFKIYAASKLRIDVHRRDFFPGHEPGAVLRFSPVHGLLSGEERHPDEYTLLNTFPGFLIKPIGTIDPTVMTRAVSLLDRMLGLLTQEHDAQMWWLKKFIAWTVQHPEIKQQVCPIIVGGQGIGKSIFGHNLMKALLGSMAGLTGADSLADNKFLITPFVGKLITFVDEVRLESVGAINTIKNLVRADNVSGEVKFGHRRDYYIPSRLIIASNQPDIGLTPADAADRAFFFIMSWTAENKRMTDNEFLEWSNTLKPFYTEFVAALENVVFRQHLMRYFHDVEATRIELEDLQHSSRKDENVVRATMSKAREVAREIVADARILPANDITAWFTRNQLRDAIKRHEGTRTQVEPDQVMMEFERAGVLVKERGDYRRFKYRYGTLLQKMGEAHNLELPANWPLRPDEDWGENDVKSQNGGPGWRGNKQQQRKSAEPQQYYDPDAMEDF